MYRLCLKTSIQLLVWKKAITPRLLQFHKHYGNSDLKRYNQHHAVILPGIMLY